jgi:deazaflavin-dependent oxidoreductase (nitroreductase family)
MPTDEEFLAMNQEVIREFRTHDGVVTQPTFPIVLLTTTGARTGRRTTTPVAFGVDSGRVFVVACKGGASTNPAWFHNLRANPSVTVENGKQSHEARAIVVEGDERDRLYGLISAQVSAFGEYEQNTDRSFPVVVLDGAPTDA